MTERDLIGDLRLTRERFATLVAEIRPELHRYCARMTGSIADGEDVVQDTLARAYYELPELKELPPLRPWLFRMAGWTAAKSSPSSGALVIRIPDTSSCSTSPMAGSSRSATS